MEGKKKYRIVLKRKGSLTHEVKIFHSNHVLTVIKSLKEYGHQVVQCSQIIQIPTKGV